MSYLPLSKLATRRRIAQHAYRPWPFTCPFAQPYRSVIRSTESWADEETLYAFDRRIYDWLVGAMHPTVAAFMRSVIHFGDTLVIVAVAVATGAYLLHRKHRWRVAGLVVAVGGGSAILWGLKWIFARSRPEAHLAAAMGHSFPSGHAFNSVTLYGFLIYLTWRMVERDAVRIGVTIVLIALVFLVGLDSLAVGAAKAFDLTVCTLHLAPFEQAGLRIDGLVGLNFLKAFRVTLDFERSRLLLIEP